MPQDAATVAKVLVIICEVLLELPGGPLYKVRKD